MDSEILKNKRFLVFGTGAVGGFYGGMLAKAGYNVTFIARGENFKALKEKGLTLIREGKKEIIPINVVEVINELPKAKAFDYILICVKSMDTKVAAISVKEIISENTSVVSFQNGVENEDILSEIIGEKYVLGGLAFVASRLVEPGVIEQFGYNGGLVGELNCKITQRVLDLQNIFQNIGVDIQISKDARADLWNKLVWNTSFNPISVLYRKTVDEILEDKNLFELTKNIMYEVKNVAIAHRINIRTDTVEFNLGRSKGFTGFKTSMLQDFERKKPIELEEIVGVVIRKAKEKNIDVPNIEKVYNSLKQKLSLSV